MSEGLIQSKGEDSTACRAQGVGDHSEVALCRTDRQETDRQETDRQEREAGDESDVGELTGSGGRVDRWRQR